MQVRQIPISDIAASPLNPRKTFDADELLELANSIKENGLIQPIIVRKASKDAEAKYEIVCGERRYRACKQLNLETIDAVVRKDLTDKQAFLCMVLENLQRANVDPFEEGAALNNLYKTGDYTVLQIAKAIGKSRSYAATRIMLSEMKPCFIALYRNKTLGLIHLQEICKLSQENQQTLYDACFTEEAIALWPQKILPMETLAAMIDEHVMNYLSTARFSLEDATFTTCKACEGCKFNTATHPKRFNDTDKPRCMKRELFQAKNLEAVLRKGKSLGVDLVYVGTEYDNSRIVDACDFAEIPITPVGNREYVVMPNEPDESKFSDKGYYATRFANYQKQKAVFDQNLADGSILPVYEVSVNGTITGELKYLYNTPHDEKGNISDDTQRYLRGIENLQRSIYESKEKEAAEVMECRRKILSESEYGKSADALAWEESALTLALMLKRVSVQFKESIGIDFATSLDTNKVLNIAMEHANEIQREYLRVSLSEESVMYSQDLGNLLTILVGFKMGEDFYSQKKDIETKHQASRDKMQESLVRLRDELNNQPASANE